MIIVTHAGTVATTIRLKSFILLQSPISPSGSLSKFTYYFQLFPHSQNYSHETQPFPFLTNPCKHTDKTQQLCLVP